jgi:hypothetical protein
MKLMRRVEKYTHKDYNRNKGILDSPDTESGLTTILYYRKKKMDLPR